MAMVAREDKIIVVIKLSGVQFGRMSVPCEFNLKLQV